jgi:hypothetical protein
MPATHAKAGSCALMCDDCMHYTRIHLNCISKCETTDDIQNYQEYDSTRIVVSTLMAETLDNQLVFRTLANHMANQLFDRMATISQHKQASADLLASEAAGRLASGMGVEDATASTTLFEDGS